MQQAVLIQDNGSLVHADYMARSNHGPGQARCQLFAHGLSVCVIDYDMTLMKTPARRLLVEQNAGLALSLANRGYLMQNGQIVTSVPSVNCAMSAMHKLCLGGVTAVA